MNTNHRLVSLYGVCLMCGLIGAGPATKPSENPVEAVRAAAVAGANASRGTDFASFKATHDCTEVGFKLNEYGMKEAADLNEIALAVKERFGADASKPFEELAGRPRAGSELDIHPALSTRWVIQIKGDRAELIEPSDNPKFPDVTQMRELHCVGGVWKLVDTAGLPDDVKPADRWAYEDQMLKKVEAIRVDIKAGKFATAKLAYDAVMRRYDTTEKHAVGQNKVVPPDDGDVPFSATVSGAGATGAGGAGVTYAGPAGDANPQPKADSTPSFSDVMEQLGRDRMVIQQAGDGQTLHLSDKQLSKWKVEQAAGEKARADVDKKHDAEMADVRKHAQEIADAIKLAGGNVDPNMILREYQNNESYYRDMAVAIHAHRVALAGILTPEQRAGSMLAVPSENR